MMRAVTRSVVQLAWSRPGGQGNQGDESLMASGLAWRARADGLPVNRWFTQVEPPSDLRGGALPTEAMRAELGPARLHTRYQPIVALHDRAPLALEVLARLDHPALGTLFPSQFVPQIEDAGLARQLTQAVIQTTIADHQAYLRPLGLALSVNFPLDVLMHQEARDCLERQCEEAMLPASSIIIELTESQPVAALSAPERRQLVATLERLRGRGFRLAIDDFGPDMPRRQDLFTLPFDLLKLDKAVVNDLARPELAEQAVRASDRAGFKVVAEGVEAPDTWRRMQALGVGYAQGFLISHPLPAAGVAGWLQEWDSASG